MKVSDLFELIIPNEPIKEIFMSSFNQKNNVEIEPFLLNEHITFHTNFSLIDLAMNTSEIKPLHLSVPKNRIQPKTTAGTEKRNLESTGQDQNYPNKDQSHSKHLSNITGKSIEEEQNGFAGKYTKTFLQIAKSVISSDTPTSSQQSASPKDSHPLESPTPRNLHHSHAHSSNQDDVPSQSLIGIAIQNGKHLSQEQDFWLYPLAPSYTVRYSFIIDSSPQVGLAFHMTPDGGKEKLLTAVMNGSTRENNFKVFSGNEFLGESRYAESNHSLFFGLMNQQTPTEITAVIFNQSFISPRQPCIFDFLIPALKKVDGRSKMFPITFGMSSGLIARLTKMSREAIRLKSKVPQNQKEDPSQFDMTFGGTFYENSLSNFILYHEQNVNKEICKFGQVSDSTFSLEISYPMAPIQGFLAAVSASMPY